MTFRRPRPAIPDDTPRRPPDQDEQRHMRRRWLCDLHYDGRFSLSAEVEAVSASLVARVAASADPAAYVAAVAEFSDSAHELVSTITGWLAEARARAQTTERSVRLATDIAQRPAYPEIDAEACRLGTWGKLLAQMAAPCDAPLAELLRHAYPPDAPPLRGNPSLSERLVDLLRDFDRAARYLAHRCDLITARLALPRSERLQQIHVTRDAPR